MRNPALGRRVARVGLIDEASNGRLAHVGLIDRSNVRRGDVESAPVISAPASPDPEGSVSRRRVKKPDASDPVVVAGPVGQAHSLPGMTVGTRRVAELSAFTRSKSETLFLDARKRVGVVGPNQATLNAT